MLGVLLLSKNNCYASYDGSVAWGPPEDKKWLRNLIKDQNVFVGKRTWETIKNYKQLIALPKAWHFIYPKRTTDIHFGGVKSLMQFRPEILIIHRTYFDIEGVKLPEKFFRGYALITVIHFNGIYQEEIYEKRW